MWLPSACNEPGIYLILIIYIYIYIYIYTYIYIYIYKEHIDKRYVNKSKKLFDRLPFVKILVDRKQEQEKKVDLCKENLKFCRKIDVARSRRYNIYKLLSHEILEN